MSTEVGSAFVSIVPSAKGFGSKLSKAVDGPSDGAGRRGGRTFGTAFARTGVGPIKAGFGTIGKAATGIFAGIAVGSFFKDAISGASDLSESASKVNVVFGKQADVVLKASETSAKAMGLSKQAYLEANGTLGNLLVSLGIGPKKAAGLSTNMVKLAGDMASFNNVSPEEALDALRSGLTGETEPLKRFGVNMNDATLKAQALKMHLIKNTKQALTPQNKALAAQALIMDQTKTAQGDFARTSGGLANQQRILSAQFADAKTKLGGVLLPIVTKAVTAFNTKLFPALQKIGGGIKVFFQAFSGGGGGATALTGKMATLAKVGATLGNFFRDVLVPAVQRFAGFITGSVVPAVQRFLPVLERVGAAILARVVPAFRTVAAFIAANFMPTVRAIGGFITGSLLPALVRVGGFLATNFGPTFTALSAVIRANVLPALQGLWVRFQQIAPTLLQVAKFVGTVIGVLLVVVAVILGKVLPVVIRFAGPVIQLWIAALGKVIGVIAAVVRVWLSMAGVGVRVAVAVGRFVAMVVGFFVQLHRGIQSKVNGLIGVVKTIPGRVIAAFSGAASWLLAPGKRIVSGLVRGLSGIASAAGRILATARAKVFTMFGNAGTWLIEAGKELVRGFISGIGKLAGAAGTAAKNMAQSAIDGAKGLLHIKSPSRVFMKIGGQVVDGFVLGMTKAQVKAARAAGTLAKKVTDAIKKAIPGIKQRLADVVSASRDMARGVADAVRGTFDVSSVRDGTGGLIENLKAQVAKAKQFAAALAAAKKKGVNAGLLAQIGQAGPNSGMNAALAVASAGAGDVKTINSLLGQLSAAGNKAGKTVADSLYAKQIASLKRQEALLERALHGRTNLNLYDANGVFMGAVRAEVKRENKKQARKVKTGTHR